ncbi:MAG: hypothetical protein EBY28_10600 [Betaproteobacteria bacterium]|nr:hypothetical protein [Betaproteobacteria bacterium]
MRRPTTWATWAGLAAAAYTAISKLSVHQPADLADDQACRFVAGDFAADGHLLHAPLDAWWISCVRSPAPHTRGRRMSISTAATSIAATACCC